MAPTSRKSRALARKAKPVVETPNVQAKNPEVEEQDEPMEETAENTNDITTEASAAVTCCTIIETTTTEPPITNSHLSGIQQQAVDAVFQKLFGYSWGTAFGFSNNTNKQDDRTSRILVEIFGSTAAACILQSVDTEKVQQQQQQRSTTIVPKQQAHNTKPIVHRKQQHYKAAAPAPPTAVRAAATSPRTTKPAAAATAAGVDQLLSQIGGGDKPTVTAKTAADWETFKGQNRGLGEKLEAQADSKQAFLKRQDFLQRVDHRQFDLEKVDRDKERSKRGK